MSSKGNAGGSGADREAKDDEMDLVKRKKINDDGVTEEELKAQ